MPLIGAKSLLIQYHDRTRIESENLDQEMQSETGLTGTPYAVTLLDLRKVFQSDRRNFRASVKPIQS